MLHSCLKPPAIHCCQSSDIPHTKWLLRQDNVMFYTLTYLTHLTCFLLFCIFLSFLIYCSTEFRSNFLHGRSATMQTVYLYYVRWRQKSFFDLSMHTYHHSQLQYRCCYNLMIYDNSPINSRSLYSSHAQITASECTTNTVINAVLG